MRSPSAARGRHPVKVGTGFVVIDWLIDKTFMPGMLVGFVSPLIMLLVVGNLYVRRRPAVHPFLY